MKRAVLCRLFYGYLKCLERTVKVRWVSPEEFKGLHVIGFWHEDSFVMNLVLKRLTEADADVEVMVTGDERGEYIQYLVEKCGGEAVRIDYGKGSIQALTRVLKDLKKKEKNVAIAMDGPLGPRHMAKKLPLLLSEKSKAELVGVTASYSSKFALKKRWDHYRIPLPFSTVTVQFDNYGIAGSGKIPDFRVCHNEQECSIISTRTAMKERETLELWR